MVLILPPAPSHVKRTNSDFYLDQWRVMEESVWALVQELKELQTPDDGDADTVEGQSYSWGPATLLHLLLWACRGVVIHSAWSPCLLPTSLLGCRDRKGKSESSSWPPPPSIAAYKVIHRKGDSSGDLGRVLKKMLTIYICSIQQTVYWMKYEPRMIGEGGHMKWMSSDFYLYQGDLLRY